MVLRRTDWLLCSSTALAWLIFYLCVLAGRLLGKEDGQDVGKNSSLRDGDAGQKLVELLIAPDGELKVTRVDPGLLVVPGSVAGQLKDLGSEVFHHCSQVDRSSGSNPLCIVALPDMISSL